MKSGTNLTILDSEAKIDDFYLAVLVECNRTALDISVDDAPLMVQVGHSSNNTANNVFQVRTQLYVLTCCMRLVGQIVSKLYISPCT